MKTFDFIAYKAGQLEAIYFFKQIADEHTPEDVVMSIRQVFEKAQQNPIPWIKGEDSDETKDDTRYPN